MTDVLAHPDVLVPEISQVVRCRGRVWAVNEVTPSALPPDPIAGDEFEQPSDQRNSPCARPHAKAVLVDGDAVLLTSANLSNAALDRYIELGVLCRGGKTADQIQQHFDALIAQAPLRRCDR